jgi:phosphoribosylformylglycinamidine synthase subunit PurS
MKAHVYVTLKQSVLDPQGQAIHNALRKMQFQGIEDIRQGKYFVIRLNDQLDAAAANAEIERIAREVLANPVIEEFTFHLEEGE